MNKRGTCIDCGIDTSYWKTIRCWDITNGQTLCKACHKLTKTYLCNKSKKGELKWEINGQTIDRSLL